MATILKTIVMYAVLLLSFRISHKRALDSLTPFDFVVLLVIGGAAVPTILGEDRSIVNAVVVIATLLVMHTLLAWLKTKSRTMGKIVDGTPLVIFENGRMLRDRMRKLLLTEQDLMSSVRDKGLQNLDDIRYALVERNGAIVVIPR